MRVFLILFITVSLFGDPWGKDADLVHAAQSSPKTCQTPLLGPIAEKLIEFHQKVISPADGPRSHYYPSSSQYMLDAIRKYGLFKGIPIGCDRLMRENSDPWIYPVIETSEACLKFDPVK